MANDKVKPIITKEDKIIERPVTQDTGKYMDALNKRPLRVKTILKGYPEIQKGFDQDQKKHGR